MFKLLKTRLAITLFLGISLILIFSIILMGYFSIHYLDNFNTFVVSELENNIRKNSESILLSNIKPNAKGISKNLKQLSVSAFALSEKISNYYKKRINSLKAKDLHRKFIVSSDGHITNYLSKNIFAALLESYIKINKDGYIPKKMKEDLIVLSGVDTIMQKSFNDISHGIPVSTIWFLSAYDFSLAFPASLYINAKTVTYDRASLPPSLKEIYNKKEVWTDIYESVTGQSMIAAVAPVYVDHKLLGIVGVSLDFDKIWEEILDEININQSTDNNFCFIIKYNGDTVILPNEQFDVFSLPFEDDIAGAADKYYRSNLLSSYNPSVKSLLKIIQNKKSDVKNLTLMGKPYTIAYSRINSVNWILCYARSDKEMLSLIESTNTNTALIKNEIISRFIYILILAIIISVLAAILFLNKIFLVNINKLIEGLRNISKGNLDCYIDIKQKGEIGELVDSFNDMTKDLRESKNELYKYQNHLEKLVETRTKELSQTNKALKKATNAMSNFLANMSHEIRTPLNAILGFTDIIKRKVNEKKLKEKLSVITANGNTLLRLIDDILDLSKVEAGKIELKYEPVNLFSIAREIELTFQPKASKKNIELITEIKSEKIPEYILIDGIRLRQIIFNLISNAIKFTSSGYVKLKFIGKYNKKVFNLKIIVEDTGIGIPKKQQSAIFDAFIQQKNQDIAKYGGTGLGLTITKKLITLMKGKIYLNSSLNKGSKFTVYFPGVTVISEDEINVNHSVAINTDLIKFEKATIIVADDIKTNRDLIINFLENQNFKLIECENGKQLIDAVNIYNPDLLLVDLKMPVLDGYTAVEKLRQNLKTRNIPIIFISASVKGEEKRIMKLKDIAFLRKPIKKEYLILQLIKFLAYTIDEKKVNFIKKQNEDDIYNNISNDIKIQLEGKFYLEWKQVKNKFIIDDIEVFAHKIKKYGENQSLKPLIIWSDMIIKELEFNDIKNLRITFDKFQKFVL